MHIGYCTKRSWRMLGLIATIAFSLAACTPDASDGRVEVTEKTVALDLLKSQCAVLANRVDSIPGSGPLLLRSYDAALVVNGVADESLRTAAFSYDNALAVIALIACEKTSQAKRIAEALRLASNSERLRNTYREGAVESTPLSNGWWSESESRWIEDEYQASSATGNVAWVALAMLTIAAKDEDPRWRVAAVRLGDWVVQQARDASGEVGFTGGLHGFDGKEQKLAWKSTEHNTDLVALFDLLAAQDNSTAWSQYRDEAFTFLGKQWISSEGRFLVGTLPDGQPNHSTSGLDALLWPLLVRESRPEWIQSIDYAIRHHGVGAGFDFNADRDGIWTEGTAQAALVLATVGREREANLSLQEVVKREQSSQPNSYLPATDRERITTGLAVGLGGESADFFYYQRPHLAASAWAILAAARWNPFLIARLDSTSASVGKARGAAEN